MKTQIVTSAALSVLGIIALVTVYGYSRSATPAAGDPWGRTHESISVGAMPRIAPGVDEVSADIVRFQPVLRAIPLTSKLGYITDLANPNKGDNSDLPYLSRYLKVTYAMAPMLVDPKLNQPGRLILTDFRSEPDRHVKDLGDKYRIERDFGDGVLLVEKIK